jgi:hypothetical protein
MYKEFPNRKKGEVTRDSSSVSKVYKYLYKVERITPDIINQKVRHGMKKIGK